MSQLPSQTLSASRQGVCPGAPGKGHLGLSTLQFSIPSHVALGNYEEVLRPRGYLFFLLIYIYRELGGPGFVQALELQDKTDRAPGLPELAFIGKTGAGHPHR